MVPSRKGIFLARNEREELDDLALIRDFQSGDVDALTFLLKRRQTWLYNVAKRAVSDPQVAEDGLQEALVQIWKGAKDFRGDSQVTTWMYQIVTRCCIDVVRKENVRKADAMPEDSENLIGSTTGFEGKVVDTLFIHGALAEFRDEFMVGHRKGECHLPGGVGCVGPFTPKRTRARAVLPGREIGRAHV